jgi:hypothetical protein
VTEAEPEWVLDTPDPQATRDAIDRLKRVPGGANTVAILRNGGFVDDDIACMSIRALAYQQEELTAQGFTPEGRKPRRPSPPRKAASGWGTLIGAAVGLVMIIMLVLNHNAAIKQDIASKKAEASEKEEIALLSDPARGPAEIDRRLRDRMSIHSGMVTIVSDPGAIDIYSFPREAGWLVSCGFGVLVSFGTVPGGDAVVNVSTDVAPTTDECKAIAPLVGERVRAFLAAAE